jgi:hypothetical protein
MTELPVTELPVTKLPLRKTNNAIFAQQIWPIKSLETLPTVTTLRWEISFVLLDKAVLSPFLNKILIFASLFQYDRALT